MSENIRGEELDERQEGDDSRDLNRDSSRTDSNKPHRLNGFDGKSEESETHGEDDNLDEDESEGVGVSVGILVGRFGVARILSVWALPNPSNAIVKSNKKPLRILGNYTIFIHITLSFAILRKRG